NEIVELGERLVTGERLNLVHDEIWWSRPVGPHHFGCRPKPCGFVSFESFERVFPFGEEVRKDSYIDQGLSGSVGASRIHRMCGVARERNSAERPALNGIF